jgi:DNA-binding XRE family transcriptional regulator
MTDQPISSLAPVFSGPPARVSLDGRPLTYSECLFLKQLGDRVRATRLRRGLSRRGLARRSGISERYIARIEAGTGNVSIVLLLRIAQALRGAEAVSMLGGDCWENWF